MKSQSIENYLKAIYTLLEEQNNEPVSTTGLAARLGVANASVTGMLKRLDALGLVEYQRYNGVTLSSQGMKLALEVIRHHRLLESYLNQMLGYSWDEVHDEAERLEHVISEEMEDRLASALGHPLTDPHGDPIPDREGNVHLPEYQPLADMPNGQPAEIGRVMEQEPAFLRYLAELGLVPAAQVQVESREPFNGPVSIRLIGSKEPARSIGRETAEKILVRPLDEPSLEDSHEPAR